MFTTAGYSESITPNSVFTYMNAIADQHIHVAGDSIYVPEMNRLIGSMACLGANAGAEARLTSPSIRRFAPHYIRPVHLQISPTTNAMHDINYNSEIILDIDEQLEVEDNASNAAPEQHAVIVWLSDTSIVPVKGQIFTINATITLAQVVNTWTPSAITFIDDLPVGTYDIVGMDVVVSGGIAARLVPIGAFNRPGVPCTEACDKHDKSQMFRHGNMGVFCSFPHNNIPSIEVLGSAAVGSATYQIYLDIMKR